MKEAGGTKGEVKHSILKVIIPCIIPSIIGYGIYFTGTEENIVSAVICGVIGGIVFGAVAGYFLWAIMTNGSLFKNAAKSVPMLVNTAGSGKGFVKRMQRYSSEFSYEYFSDKVVSLLKMLIFAEDATQLPQYVGKPLENMFKNIVESSYTGAVALKKFEVKKDIAFVTVDVYMEDFYDNGKRIYKKEDKFRVTLRKNIKQPVNYYFSIKKIQCKGCADSFDATKHRNCPSCGLRYEIEDDDWVVMEILF